MGVNDAAPVAFINQRTSDRRLVTVCPVGRPGNPVAVGSQVRLIATGGKRQTGEVYADGGFLLQSFPQLSFGPPTGKTVVQVEVRWPDGMPTIRNHDLETPSINHRPEDSL